MRNVAVYVVANGQKATSNVMTQKAAIWNVGKSCVCPFLLVSVFVVRKETKWIGLGMVATHEMSLDERTLIPLAVVGVRAC